MTLPTIEVGGDFGFGGTNHLSMLKLNIYQVSTAF